MNIKSQNYAQSMDFRFGVTVIVLLCLGTNGDPIYLDCDSPDGKASDVNVSDCKEKPCVLKKGQSYSIDVTFTSKVGSNNSKAVVHGIVAGVPIPFPIPDADGCKSGITCPIQKDQKYQYHTTLPVLPSYPSMKLVVKWELKDDQAKSVFCIEFPVIIKP